MKSLTNPKVLGVQKIFNQGKGDCLHLWIYDKPLAMTFTCPAVISQERLCKCCGRFERVHLEGKQANYDVEAFVAEKKHFGLK